MGNWKLEVAKMGLYMAFPVGVFHYFNQPAYFEEWVTKVKKDLYPPENPEHKAQFEALINNLNKRDELRLLKALEEKGS